MVRCNVSVKSISDISSVFMEFEMVSVISLPNDVEVVDVIVVLCRFSSATCASSGKRDESKTLQRFPPHAKSYLILTFIDLT